MNGTGIQPSLVSPLKGLCMLIFPRRALPSMCLAAWMVVSGCTTAPAARQPPEAAYNTTATVKDLMLSIVDPSADVVWNAVATIGDEQGIMERMPQNDEEWTLVRQGAIRLVESCNLLLIPGRKVTRPGEKSEAPGVELEGPEMEALIEQDRAAWNVRVGALHEAAVRALETIDAKDAKALFDVGGQIEHACESCHSQYWYPNQLLPPGYDQP